MNSEPPADSTSPYWSRTTKVIVVIFFLLALLWLIARFTSLIGMLVIAAILGYLLEPIINLIDRRTKLRRGLIILIVYVTLAIVVIAGFSALGFASYQQIA